MTGHDHAERVQGEVTAAVRRAAEAIKETVCTAWPAYVSDRMAMRIARDGLAAALNGPKDQYDVMDDMTIEIHAAICEDSPEDCVEWRGACVKAAEAARAALLGGAA